MSVTTGCCYDVLLALMLRWLVRRAPTEDPLPRRCTAIPGPPALLLAYRFGELPPLAGLIAPLTEAPFVVVLVYC